MAPIMPPEELTFEQFRITCEEIVAPLRAISDQFGLKLRAENEHYLPTTRLTISATAYWGGEPFAWISPPNVQNGKWWVYALGVPLDIEGNNLSPAEASTILMQRLKGHIEWIKHREVYMRDADALLIRINARLSGQSAAVTSLAPAGAGAPRQLE